MRSGPSHIVLPFAPLPSSRTSSHGTKEDGPRNKVLQRLKRRTV